MTLDEIFNHGKDFAAVAFEATGAVQPMWICETDDGELMPLFLPVPFDNDDKNAIVATLIDFFREKRVVRYVSLVESWMVDTSTVPKADIDKLVSGEKRASQYKSRQEIIYIGAEDKQHNFRSGYYTIIRTVDGPPKLSPFRMDGDTQVDGRFTHLLQQQSGWRQ